MHAVAANGRQRGRRADAVPLERIVPTNGAGERLQAIDVAIGGGDEPVAVQQERDVTGFHLVVGPDDVARVAVKSQGVPVQTHEDQLIDGHSWHD